MLDAARPVGLHAYAAQVGVTIERVAGESDEIRQLVAELDQDLSGPYLPEQRHALSLDQLFEDNVRFFAARLDGVAVGCGGVAFYDGYAEVKRMFTRPEARGRGLARRLLEALERVAARLGARELVLETGVRQEEAIRLYRRAGFEEIPAYGEYVDSPLSVCMRKLL